MRFTTTTVVPESSPFMAGPTAKAASKGIISGSFQEQKATRWVVLFVRIIVSHGHNEFDRDISD